MDHAASHASHLLPAALAHADPVGVGALVAALFVAGAVGGLTHCAPMCGPFVLAQVGGGAPGGGVLRRLSAGLALPYHLGRLTTYGLLGAAAGGLGGALADFAPLRWLLGGFLLLAAALFAARAVPAWKPRVASGAGPAGRWGDALARVARPLLRRPGGWRGYALGVALGFLPCGFLYAALAAAAGSGGALAGGAAMVAFAVGTMPSLWGVGLLGAAATQRWRGLARAATPPLFLLNAMTLAAMAVRAVG